MSAGRAAAAVRCYSKYKLAVTAWQRLRGLLFREGGWLAEGQELVLVPCSGVHTFGMKHDIDIAFADKEGKVLMVVRNCPPGRLVSCAGAWITVERYARGQKSAWYEAGQYFDLRCA